MGKTRPGRSSYNEPHDGDDAVEEREEEEERVDRIIGSNQRERRRVVATTNIDQTYAVLTIGGKAGR